MKTGLVLEGGAMCGLFTAGVLDVLLDEKISFPYVIGVSSGAGSALGFVSKQKGRTRHVICPDKKESYYGWRTFLRKGKFMDLDKMFFEYPFKQYPFDFHVFFNSPTDCEFVLTECENGQVRYFSERSDKKRLLTIGKASCSLPMLSSVVELDGRHYVDGSVADAVPFERAIEQGCDRVVVVLAKSDSAHHTDYTKYRRVMKLLYGKKYPEFLKACMSRLQAYAKQREQLDKLEAEGRAFVIKPLLPPIGSSEKDKEKIDGYYNHGLEEMKKQLQSLKEFLK